MAIADIIAQFEAMGIFNFYLPFIILFAIFYALLTKSGIFGDPDKPLTRKINLIVALGASAYVLIYSPISGNVLTLGQYLSTLFGQTFVILMTILAILIVGYVALIPLAIPEEKKKEWVPLGAKLIIGCLIILGIGLFISSGGFTYFFAGWPGAPTIILPGISLSLEDVAIISMVVLTGLVIYWLISVPSEKRKEAAR